LDTELKATKNRRAALLMELFHQCGKVESERVTFGYWKEDASIFPFFGISYLFDWITTLHFERRE